MKYVLRVSRNGDLKTLEVIYNEATKTILHFQLF